ncbi:MAG TPA: ABC transporter permease [Nitrolancea sp.]|jgi:ABC-type dipeptide/oligopeptide/nickel transport system permease component|nr:ABC transporter permease [Nitrolancea sp.]
MYLNWIIRRAVYLILVLWAATVVVFLMMHLAPGDPAQAMLGPMASGDALANLRQQLGLNDPLYIQYFHWMGHALEGNLGRSIRQQVPVTSLIFSQFKNTVILGSISFVIAVTGGLALGFLAGIKRGSLLDRIIIVIASSGIAIPSFFLGLLLAYVFGIRFHVLPSNGMYSLQGGGGIGDLLKHLALPAITLAVGPIAVVARMTRSSTLEVMGQDYVRTARAKGLHDRTVALRHIFKNALIPIIHLLGLQAGILLSATALVEIVFSWPGIGALMVNSILTRDLPVTQGSVLLIAAVYAVISVVADLAHMLVDPRVHQS